MIDHKTPKITQVMCLKDNDLANCLISLQFLAASTDFFLSSETLCSVTSLYYPPCIIRNKSQYTC